MFALLITESQRNADFWASVFGTGVLVVFLVVLLAVIVSALFEETHVKSCQCPRCDRGRRPRGGGMIDF